MKKYALSTLVMASIVLAPVALRADCGKECCPASKKECKAECAETTGGPCCLETKATKMTKVDYQVDGLACGACETKVTTALEKVEGVAEISACSKSKHVKLQYDAKRVKEKQLMAAVQQAGFKVSAETVELKVDGMTCGGCSGKVGSALTKVNGVKEQKVCHESNQAVITFDPYKVSREQIVAAIDNTGFKVVQ